MGKPNSFNRLLQLREYILELRQTWGTETSKYPQEEKEKSIP